MTARARTIPRPRRRRAPALRSGVTLLEVVLAGLLLGLATSTITSAFGVIQTLSERGRRRLEAAEIAHRAILQYLDDPTRIDAQGREVWNMGKGKYRILIYEQSLSRTEGDQVSIRKATASAGIDLNTLLRNRLLMVTVEVFEDVGGQRAPAPVEVLSRITDPLGYSDDEGAQEKHIENLFKGVPELRDKLRDAMRSRRTGQAGGGSAQPGAKPGVAP